MATFVKLTSVYTSPIEIWVNLDQVMYMRRLPAHTGSTYHSPAPERTRIDFGQFGETMDSSNFTEVTETPEQILGAAS